MKRANTRANNVKIAVAALLLATPALAVEMPEYCQEKPAPAAASACLTCPGGGAKINIPLDAATMASLSEVGKSLKKLNDNDFRQDLISTSLTALLDHREQLLSMYLNSSEDVYQSHRRLDSCFKNQKEYFNQFIEQQNKMYDRFKDKGKQIEAEEKSNAFEAKYLAAAIDSKNYFDLQNKYDALIKKHEDKILAFEQKVTAAAQVGGNASMLLGPGVLVLQNSRFAKEQIEINQVKEKVEAIRAEFKRRAKRYQYLFNEYPMLFKFPQTVTKSKLAPSELQQTMISAMELTTEGMDAAKSFSDDDRAQFAQNFIALRYSKTDPEAAKRSQKIHTAMASAAANTVSELELAARDICGNNGKYLHLDPKLVESVMKKREADGYSKAEMQKSHCAMIKAQPGEHGVWMSVAGLGLLAAGGVMAVTGVGAALIPSGAMILAGGGFTVIQAVDMVTDLHRLQVTSGLYKVQLADQKQLAEDYDRFKSDRNWTAVSAALAPLDAVGLYQAGKYIGNGTFRQILKEKGWKEALKYKDPLIKSTSAAKGVAQAEKLPTEIKAGATDTKTSFENGLLTGTAHKSKFSGLPDDAILPMIGKPSTTLDDHVAIFDALVGKQTVDGQAAAHMKRLDAAITKQAKERIPGIGDRYWDKASTEDKVVWFRPSDKLADQIAKMPKTEHDRIAKEYHLLINKFAQEDREDAIKLIYAGELKGASKDNITKFVGNINCGGK